jgi:hypothetical protein
MQARKNSPPKKQADSKKNQPYIKTATDAAIEAVANRLSDREIIRDAAGFVNKHISRQPPVQRFFSFMPTMLTRVSPFHFRSRGKLEEWPLVRLDSGDGNSWGRMQVVGELLIIFDETVLFGLLALMTKYKSDAFETSQAELGLLADSQPSSKTNSAIWKSIQRLAGTRIDLILYSGKGRKRRNVKELTGSILSFADMDQSTGKIRVIINPYFLEMYADSFVTNIDMRFRSRLKSDISKAFYRFFQGQYELESNLELAKLARAVNLDTNTDNRRLRDKVRTGLRELKEKGYLENFEITKEHRIIAVKAKDTAANFDSQILGSAEIP